MEQSRDVQSDDKNTAFAHLSLGQRIWIFGSFFRLPLLGWSLSMFILGALSPGGGLSARVLSAAFVVLPFHIVFAVVNDLATIEVDRRNPRKAASPLVSGIVNATAARSLVICAAALAFPWDILILGFSPIRSVLIATAFAATAVYNIAGKRSRVPFLMDFLLGVGSASLLCYGALAASGRLVSTSYLVSAAVVIYITLDNGVHFSVRDIDSDLQCGVRTTAILMGARPRKSGAPYLPGRFMGIAFCLQFLLTAITLPPIIVDYNKGLVDTAVLLVASLLAFASYIFILPAIDAARSDKYRYAGGYAQSLCAFGSVAALGCAKYGALATIGTLTVLIIPLGAQSATRLVRGAPVFGAGILKATTSESDPESRSS